SRNFFDLPDKRRRSPRRDNYLIYEFVQSDFSFLTFGYPIWWRLDYMWMNPAFGVYVAIASSIRVNNPKKRPDLLFVRILPPFVGYVAEQIRFDHETRFVSN